MESRLRKLRMSRELTLLALREALLGVGLSRTVGYLSMLERGLVWPGKSVVDALVKLFAGQITEVQICYPFGKPDEEITNVA